MDLLLKLIGGGWAAGYRTYIVGWLMVLQAVAAWALGDQTGGELLHKLPELLGGVGLVTLRAAVERLIALLEAVVSKRGADRP